jgi:hypothetical protein
MSTNSVGNWGFILPPPVPSAKNRSLNNYQYILYHRPDFTKTTKKRESAIGSIEYTIKKGIITVKSGIKKKRISALKQTKIRSDIKKEIITIEWSSYFQRVVSLCNVCLNCRQKLQHKIILRQYVVKWCVFVFLEWIIDV